MIKACIDTGHNSDCSDTASLSRWLAGEFFETRSSVAQVNPIRETDPEARALALSLIKTARFGSLGVIDPQTATPMVSRVAVGTDPSGHPVTLISELSFHTKALKENPKCSLLLGEPGPKGDPLTHPRITLQATALFVSQGDDDYGVLRQHYIQSHPKAKLYIDFADFRFAVLQVSKAHLNGGFGKAYVLRPEDLRS